MAGMASDKPIKAIASGFLVIRYIFHHTTVIIIRMAMVKKNRWITYRRNSFKRMATNGLLGWSGGEGSIILQK
jgi:hypothetical protein